MPAEHSDPSSRLQRAAMLSVRQLFCERDERVLFSGLDFDLDEGQVLQVKGGNGTGKTTLLRMVCGLNDAYEGAIEFYGAPIAGQAEEFFRQLLYIGHRVGVNKVLSPLENLRWACSLRAPASDDQLNAALASVGLRGFEHSQCYTLSAGQQQRVSLARLLLNAPRLWVLDEPFTTLDARGVKLLEALIRQHADAGGAVLVTTHHAIEVADLKTLTLGREQ